MKCGRCEKDMKAHEVNAEVMRVTLAAPGMTDLRLVLCGDCGVQLALFFDPTMADDPVYMARVAEISAMRKELDILEAE